MKEAALLTERAKYLESAEQKEVVKTAADLALKKALSKIDFPLGEEYNPNLRMSPEKDNIRAAKKALEQLLPS
jgi:hypothetical protein